MDICYNKIVSGLDVMVFRQPKVNSDLIIKVTLNYNANFEHLLCAM